MGMSTTIVALLALAAAGQAAPDKAYCINTRDPKIPIILPADPARRAEIDQLFLYVSSDEGRTWQQIAVASPTQEAFPFFAQADGSYWFNVSIMDKRKRMDPPDVSAVPPALKIVVDTRKPIVRIHSLERQADTATVAWEVQDENLDLSSFRLEYRTSESPTWYMVPISPVSASGQKRWPVSAPGPLYLRLQVQDHAGNMGMAQAELPGEGGAVTTTSGFSPSAPASPVRPPMAANTGTFPSHNWERARTNPARPDSEAIRPTISSYVNTPAPPPAPAEHAGPRVVAASENASTTAPAAAAGSAAPRSRGPVQFINSQHVDLNYEVSKVGPSGVGAVELWSTEDNGRSWRRFAEDADLRPPFAADLPAEGVYGFTLIVRSKAGLGKQAPMPGDAPELRLEVDTTPPVAQLYAPEADPRHREMLVLLWNAGDRNLSTNPITLQWSERPGGTWETIAADLPNSGRYTWQMPANLPYRVYLRLEVRDLAGNVSLAETPEPVLVDLSEPEGKLTGVVAPARKPSP